MNFSYLEQTGDPEFANNIKSHVLKSLNCEIVECDRPRVSVYFICKFCLLLLLRLLLLRSLHRDGSSLLLTQVIVAQTVTGTRTRSPVKPLTVHVFVILAMTADKRRVRNVSSPKPPVGLLSFSVPVTGRSDPIARRPPRHDRGTAGAPFSLTMTLSLFPRCQLAQSQYRQKHIQATPSNGYHRGVSRIIILRLCRSLLRLLEARHR